MRIHPFVIGYTVGAAVVGLATGSLLGALAALAGVVIGAGGALVSCLVCWGWPGLEARPVVLWPVAVLANPVMLVALGLMIDGSQCLIGDRSGWDCMAPAVAVFVAILCLLPPFGGLLWRRLRRQLPG
jgi:hypothetical protein